MKSIEKFRVVPFTNPSGQIVSRVIGTLDGKLIRENYQDLPVALARKQELEIQALNAPLVLTMQPTRLSVAELRDAEAALRRLHDTTHTLACVVDFFLRNFRDDLVTKTVDEAYELFIAEKRAHRLRPRSLVDLENRLRILKKSWGNRPVSQITAADVKVALYGGDRCPQTLVNYRRVAHSFFAWCERQSYTLTNVVTKVDAPSVQRGEPEILALADVQALLGAALAHKEGVMVPYLAVALFSGVRTTELKRIGWADVDLEGKIVTISAAVAKLRSRRLIDITGNLIDWLTQFRHQPLCPANWRKDFDVVRRAAGFKGSLAKECDKGLKPWPVNVLRHTCISYWQAHFKDEGACADRHGNSVDVIHQHYRGLVKPQAAAQFWGLTPNSVAKMETPAARTELAA